MLLLSCLGLGYHSAFTLNFYVSKESVAKYGMG